MFLYGGSGSVSEVESVTGTLTAGLLRCSKAWLGGKFDMQIYDELFDGLVAGRFELEWRQQMFFDDAADHDDDEDASDHGESSESHGDGDDKMEVD